jgi:hypothetical protein
MTLDCFGQALRPMADGRHLDGQTLCLKAGSGGGGSGTSLIPSISSITNAVLHPLKPFWVRRGGMPWPNPRLLRVDRDRAAARRQHDFSISPSPPSVEADCIVDSASSLRLGLTLPPSIVDMSYTCNPTMRRPWANTTRILEPGRRPEAVTHTRRQGLAPSPTGWTNQSRLFRSMTDVVHQFGALSLWTSFVTFARYTKQSGVIAKETCCKYRLFRQRTSRDCVLAA